MGNKVIIRKPKRQRTRSEKLWIALSALLVIAMVASSLVSLLN